MLTSLCALAFARQRCQGVPPTTSSHTPQPSSYMTEVSVHGDGIWRSYKPPKGFRRFGNSLPDYDMFNYTSMGYRAIKPTDCITLPISHLVDSQGRRRLHSLSGGNILTGSRFSVTLQVTSPSETILPTNGTIEAEQGSRKITMRTCVTSGLLASSRPGSSFKQTI